MDYNTCRTCLGHGFLTDIFQQRGLELISTRIIGLANVNITPTDGLPDKICADCIEKLDHCIIFINMCQDADKKLRKLYKNDDVDSQTSLEIDIDDESYSLGIEDKHFVSNLQSEDDAADRVLSSAVKDEDILSTKIKKSKEKKRKDRSTLKNDKLKSDDKKKALKQQCFTCGKVMSSRFRLKTHMRTHTGERPFACPHCDKTFTLEQNLKVHVRVHTGEKPLQCPVCSKSFAQTAGLAAHKRKHTGQTPYHCVLCPRSFRTNGHLQYHVRRHTGEKNFECDTCGKAFITRSGLKQHLLTHTGDRAHVCSVCGKRMSRASHVKRHALRAHRGLASTAQ